MSVRISRKCLSDCLPKLSAVDALLSLLGCLLVASSAAAQTGIDWRDYTGAHYSERPWSGAIRDFQGPGAAGLSFPDDGYSRKRPSRSADVSRADALIFNIGGLGSGRNERQLAAFMDAIRAQGGPRWTAAVREHVLQFAAKYRDPGREIYWQFGNEINSGQYSRAFHLWAADGRRPSAHDRSTIAWYAEYFLAPGIEGILQARREAPGLRGKLNIVLGSLGVARNPQAVEFLNQLLGYRLQGDYAPGLKGKQVYELVDVISVHYLVGTPGDGWQSILDELHEKWYGQGAVRGIWSTEEIGIRRARAGYGAATAMQVLARYMDWWLEKGVAPQASKVFFWGSDVGSGLNQADTVLAELYGFTGKGRYATVRNGLDISASAPVEAHHFRNPASGQELIFVFPGDRRAATVTHIDVSLAGKAVTAGIELRVLDPAANGRQALRVPADHGRYRITPARPIELSEAGAILIMLSTSTP